MGPIGTLLDDEVPVELDVDDVDLVVGAVPVAVAVPEDAPLLPVATA